MVQWRIPKKQWMLTAELVDSENRQMAELLLLILLLVLRRRNKRRKKENKKGAKGRKKGKEVVCIDAARQKEIAGPKRST